ncbi:MAG: serine/threonine protein kinase [Myxococcales bacterium]|nr:serine/threonine protein kinase [Myxococcales bacterium]
MSQLPSNGRTLADGRYVLVRKVAEGGTAIVHLGYDTWTETWRAVKTLQPEFAERPALRHRFEREAATMKSLSDEHIIAVYDAGVDEEVAYMVMEFAEAGSVIDWVERNGPMPPRMATQVIFQLCKGIATAHEQGIIHRDIKPQNLLVDRHGVCKVTDFGIAQIVDLETRMTMTGTVMGTIGYMAPEQHESAKHADERADVYSIAATFYTLIKGEAATHLFMAEPTDFEGIPEPLANIIRKGAEYRREARYGTVEQMIEELDQALTMIPPDPLDVPPLVSSDIPVLDDITPPSFPSQPKDDVPSYLVGMPDTEAQHQDYSPTPEMPVHIGVEDPAPGVPMPDPALQRHSLTLSHTPSVLQPYTRGRSADRGAGLRPFLVPGLAVAALLGLLLLAVILMSMNQVQRLEAALQNQHERLEHIFSEELNGRIYRTLQEIGNEDDESRLQYHDRAMELIARFDKTSAAHPDELMFEATRVQSLMEHSLLPELRERGAADGPLAARYKDMVNANEVLSREMVLVEDISEALDEVKASRSARVAGCAGVF